MKIHQILFGVLLVSASARGNVYWPKAKLAGEIVQVHMLNDVARVTAIFEFEEQVTADAKIIYFPIFALDNDGPVQVLTNAEFELDANDKTQGIATPCPTPERFRKIKFTPRVCWFAADIDELTAQPGIHAVERVVIRASYTQPLIHGRFYYLPVIVGAVDHNKDRRQWNYQMYVYSGSRVTQVLSEGTDYEQLGDSVVVFLRDGEIVEIK